MDLPDKSLPFSRFLIEDMENNYKSDRILSYIEARAESLPRWNQLTKGERNDYKKMTDEEKQEVRGMITQIQDYDRIVENRKRKEAAKKFEKVKKYLAKVVDNALDWKSSIFYLVSVNIFAKHKNDEYPAELALSKFNLKEGVKETINIHISTGSTGLPIGLFKEATMLAEETHRIAPNETRAGEYRELGFQEVKNMIQDFIGNEYVMFSFNEPLNKYSDIDATENTLHKIFGIEKVAVVSLELLVCSLQTRNGQQPRDNLNVCQKILNNQWENWSIGCTHHFHCDANKYCTLARVKRWAYQVCKLILPPQEIKSKTHKPEEIDPKDEKPSSEKQIMMILMEGEKESAAEVKTVSDKIVSLDKWLAKMKIEEQELVAALDRSSISSSSSVNLHQLPTPSKQAKVETTYSEFDFEGLLKEVEDISEKTNFDAAPAALTNHIHNYTPENLKLVELGIFPDLIPEPNAKTFESIIDEILASAPQETSPPTYSEFRLSDIEDD